MHLILSLDIVQLMKTIDWSLPFLLFLLWSAYGWRFAHIVFFHCFSFISDIHQNIPFDSFSRFWEGMRELIERCCSFARLERILLSSLLPSPSPHCGLLRLLVSFHLQRREHFNWETYRNGSIGSITGNKTRRNVFFINLHRRMPIKPQRTFRHRSLSFTRVWSHSQWLLSSTTRIWSHRLRYFKHFSAFHPQSFSSCFFHAFSFRLAHQSSFRSEGVCSIHRRLLFHQVTRRKWEAEGWRWQSQSVQRKPLRSSSFVCQRSQPESPNPLQMQQLSEYSNTFFTIKSIQYNHITNRCSKRTQSLNFERDSDSLQSSSESSLGRASGCLDVSWRSETESKCAERKRRDRSREWEWYETSTEWSLGVWFWNHLG